MQNTGRTSLVSDVTEIILTEFPLTLYSISEKKNTENCPWQATNINAYSQFARTCMQHAFNNIIRDTNATHYLFNFLGFLSFHVQFSPPNYSYF